MNQEPNQDKPSAPQESQVKPYLKYSGLAFQMIGIMAVAALGGRKLDAYFENEIPWWTLVLLLVAVVASMYKVIVSLTKK
ncbi:AtpZ/AtpI family protein [Rufibacter sp. LB8]|uniref:AtpZ/AtpI family protein n=1 Tax=Rufibacter sp. LB8 TaxID=2777781 RepID=UPI00178C2E6F|nr:AtpZ/AtpI family protein [Rufibacter sp. LB8]